MKKEGNEVFVGMFVILGFIILTITVFFVSGVYLFRPGYKIDVMYEYVSILDKGAPVRMAGVRVGEVNTVRLVFDPDMGKTRVRVNLFIEQGVRLRENYEFHIRGTHILSEPHIEITPQPGHAPVLVAETVIEGQDPLPVESLVQQAHDIAALINEILVTIRTTLDDEESRQALKDIIINLSRLTDSFNQVIGGSEKELKDSIIKFHDSIDAINAILKKMESGEGTAGKLLIDDELYQELRDFIKEIKARPWRLLKRDDDGGKFLGIF